MGSVPRVGQSIQVRSTAWEIRCCPAAQIISSCSRSWGCITQRSQNQHLRGAARAMPSPASLSSLSLAVGAVRCPVCSWPCSLPRAADGRLRRVRAAQAHSRQLILSSCVFVFTLSPGKGLPFLLPSEDGGCAATRTQGTGGGCAAWSCPARRADHGGVLAQTPFFSPPAAPHRLLVSLVTFRRLMPHT